MRLAVRDLHGASRSVMYLTLAGSAYVLGTCVLNPRTGGSGLTTGIAISVIMALGGLGSWRPTA